MYLTNPHLAEEQENLAKHGKHDHLQTEGLKNEIIIKENENDSAKGQNDHVWHETGIWF